MRVDAGRVRRCCTYIVRAAISARGVVSGVECMFTRARGASFSCFPSVLDANADPDLGRLTVQ
jgi:hypothetical protein